MICCAWFSLRLMQEVQLSQVFFYWVALSMSFTLYNRRDQGLLCSYDLATLWYDVVTLCLWCAYSSSIISSHFFCSYFPFGCSVLSFFITDLELEVLYISSDTDIFRWLTNTSNINFWTLENCYCCSAKLLRLIYFLPTGNDHVWSQNRFTSSQFFIKLDSFLWFWNCFFDFLLMISFCFFL